MRASEADGVTWGARSSRPRCGCASYRCPHVADARSAPVRVPAHHRPHHSLVGRRVGARRGRLARVPPRLPPMPADEILGLVRALQRARQGAPTPRR